MAKKKSKSEVRYSLKFIKYQEKNICYLQKFDGKGGNCEGTGIGSNDLKAFWELVKHCFRYRKIKMLLKVRKIYI